MSGVVIILICIVIVVLADLFVDYLGAPAFILIFIILLAVDILALVKLDEQAKSANFDIQETTLQDHKESQTVQNKSELNESDTVTDENKIDCENSAENRKFI